MSEVKKYRKKPVEIEAMLFAGTKESASEVLAWTMENASRAYLTEPHAPERGIEIHTLEGVMHASAGDYVIRGVQNEFYPCKPDIFEQTYEPVAHPSKEPNDDE